jgi:putative phosphoesterase
MKIAIISDTHDNAQAVTWIIDQLNQQNISTAFHAGDIINPGIIKLFEEAYKGELHFVFGNNDGEMGRALKNIAQSNKTFCYFEAMDKELAGKRIFMNHYSSIVELVAQAEVFDLAIGGHDHNYRTKQYGKTLFINPGTTSLADYYLGRREKSDKSFVILDLQTMEHQRVMIPDA